MRKDQAEQVVRAEAKFERHVVLELERLPDFDDYWYVTVVDDGTGRSAGTAYVLQEPTHLVFPVPTAMPPHFNIRSVVTGDAVALR